MKSVILLLALSLSAQAGVSKAVYKHSVKPTAKAGSKYVLKPLAKSVRAVGRVIF